MSKKKEKEEEYLPKSVKKMQKDKEKREKEDKKKKIPFKKKLKRFILLILLIAILILLIILGISAYNWKQIATDMFTNENSVVVDTDNNVIATLGSERKKIIVDYEDIPENLINAYVSIEDERYYSHHGVDVLRTGAAIVSYVVNLGDASFGGSTITQQLVKNLTGDTSSTPTRKVKEWWKAYLLECFYSKEEILEMYLNVIYVGPNVYGVATGAKYYFNKDIRRLKFSRMCISSGNK